jgi:hypothetical protein
MTEPLLIIDDVAITQRNGSARLRAVEKARPDFASAQHSVFEIEVDPGQLDV